MVPYSSLFTSLWIFLFLFKHVNGGGTIKVNVTGDPGGWSNWTFCGSCIFEITEDDIGKPTIGGTSNSIDKIIVRDTWEYYGWQRTKYQSFSDNTDPATIVVSITNPETGKTKSSRVKMIIAGKHPTEPKGGMGELGFGTDYFGHMAADHGDIMTISGYKEFSVDATKQLHDYVTSGDENLFGCSLDIKVNPGTGVPSIC